MKAAILLAALALVSGARAENFVTAAVVRKINKRRVPPPYRVSEEAAALHRSLGVVDLHADPLLWDRDLLKRNAYGHVDLPRLVDGGSTLQVFSIVTHAPNGINIKKNDAKSGDLVKALAIASGWPRATWSSRLERARHEAATLGDAVRRSNGRLVPIRSRADLKTYLASRSSGTVAALLSLEGAQALDGKAENVDVLYDLGVRMVGLTHFVDNELGGSAHGTSHGGLTEFGREVMRRLEAKSVIIDLSHASPALIDDALKAAKNPPVFSHTGVYATCPNERNLNDDQLKRVAVKGGLIGIGFWKVATCGNDAAAVAKAVAHAVSVMGVEHVSLGSDFDGAVGQPFDSAGFPLITEALLKEGLKKDQIKLIMGGNALRFLGERLPAK